MKTNSQPEYGEVEMKYKVYFEIYGKKLAMEMDIDDIENHEKIAEYRVLQSVKKEVKIIKVIPQDSVSFEELKNIFGIR